MMTRCRSVIGDHRPGGTAEISVALGGGGALGMAFHLGFARGLETEGVALKSGPMIGVSAGTWAAAALAVDMPIEAIVDIYPGLCRRPKAPVGEIAHQLFGSARDGRVTGAAIRLPSFRRVLLNGSQFPLADVVGASSSPPRLAAPMRVASQRLYDPGLLYNSCADLAAHGSSLVVLAPLGSGTLGAQGLIWQNRLWRETSAWRLKHRGRVMTIRPSRQVLRWAGQRWADVLDGDRMMKTYAMAFEDGQRYAPKLRLTLGVRQAA